jgi:hypothetical protein
MTVEQLGANPVFQGLDLLSDGARGDAKFVCRPRKTAQSCRCLEGTKRVKRRSYWAWRCNRNGEPQYFYA